MTRRRTTMTGAGAAGLALAWTLSGCTGDQPEPSSTPAATMAPSETVDAAPTASDDDGEAGPDRATPDEVPAGFPDPEALVGKEAYDERGPDGWRTVVGGEPLDLPLVFGACFEGGTEDVCAYSISASAPAQPDGTPAPSEAALLLLLRSAGEADGGTPTWEVLDATIARTPDGEPAILQVCGGRPGVAIYPAADPEDADTVPVAAAWGPDDENDDLVGLDVDDVTCVAERP